MGHKFVSKTAACSQCPINTYQDQDSQESVSCKTCPNPGSYQDQPGQKLCMRCEEGKHSSPGSSRCTQGTSSSPAPAPGSGIPGGGTSGHCTSTTCTGAPKDCDDATMWVTSGCFKKCDEAEKKMFLHHYCHGGASSPAPAHGGGTPPTTTLKCAGLTGVFGPMTEASTPPGTFQFPCGDFAKLKSNANMIEVGTCRTQGNSMECIQSACCDSNGSGNTPAPASG